MISSRRQFAWMIGAALGGAAVLNAPGAFAEDEDDIPANVFISPAGRPYRAATNAPYPVVDWFKAADKNADGKIDHAEFLADSEAFFKLLDQNHDGVLSSYEVNFYERQVAPEVLGYRVKVGAAGPRRLPGRSGARLWLAQMGGGGMGGGGGMSVDPGGDAPPADATPPHSIDESQQGASPYSFFDEPEPVAAADIQFRGIISKDDFLRLADIHFTTLDHDNEGFLTLAKLPKTPVQKALLKRRRKLF